MGGKIGREAFSLSSSGLISPLFSPPEWNDLTGGPRVLEKCTRKAQHTPLMSDVMGSGQGYANNRVEHTSIKPTPALPPPNYLQSMSRQGGIIDRLDAWIIDRSVIYKPIYLK